MDSFIHPREVTVAIHGKTITARGMGVAVEFGLELVAALCGNEKSDELRTAVIAD